jgi:hypothetical protein
MHVQTIARIESGKPGEAIGHVLRLLAPYGIAVQVPGPQDAQPGAAPQSARCHKSPAPPVLQSEGSP